MAMNKVDLNSYSAIAAKHSAANESFKKTNVAEYMPYRATVKSQHRRRRSVRGERHHHRSKHNQMSEPPVVTLDLVAMKKKPKEAPSIEVSTVEAT